MGKIFLIGLLLVGTTTCFSQDYIITWGNDTIECKLPGHPAKADLKPRYKYQNGYHRLAAVLPGDSLRVYLPGEIKAYYRRDHGKGLLCDGYFTSVKTSEAGNSRTNADGKKDEEWYFLLLVQNGEYASLYKMFSWGSRLYSYYYVVKNNADLKPAGHMLSTKKSCMAALADEDIRKEMQDYIESNKKYTDMVNEYNRLKKSALKKDKNAG